MSASSREAQPVKNGIDGVGIHLSMDNANFCSWNEFAKAIFAEENLAITVKGMTTAELNRPANRPLYSTLDCSKLAADIRYQPRHWREALKDYLQLRKLS